MSWAGAYRLLMRGLQSVATPWLKRRVSQGKEDPARLSERKGIASRPRPDGQLVWMHGASVGETTMLLPLIKRFLDDDPALHILVTSGTLTSAQLMAERLPERAFHQFVPLDGPDFVGRFLAHWKPDLAIWAESEIWPNLILQTKASGAKMALINARMSQGSIDRWRTKHNFARAVFGCFDVILPADTQTHNALKDLGGTVVSEIGNLKAAAPALTFDTDEAAQLRDTIGDRPVWLAASTHAPEESDVLWAHERLRKHRPDSLLIWLPRHPERGAEISKLCKAQSIAIRSKGERPRDQTSIYLMDTLGEMGLALNLAQTVFVGGSLDASLTGHNPLEAARARVPVLTGPHLASFAEIYERFFALQAAILIKNRNKLFKHLDASLGGGVATMRMIENAESLAQENDAVLETTVAQLEALL